MSGLDDLPLPASIEAQNAGCSCPTVEPYKDSGPIYDGDCPFHGAAVEADAEKYSDRLHDYVGLPEDWAHCGDCGFSLEGYDAIAGAMRHKVETGHNLIVSARIGGE